MAKDLSLSRLTILYVVGNLASKVIGFALFFVYTYYISKENIGYFDLIMTTVSWITPIVSLQIYDAVLRWSINNKDEETIKKVLTGSMAIVTCMAALFSILYLVAIRFLNVQHHGLIYLVILLQSLYPVLLQFARGIGKNGVFVLSGILFSLFYTVITLVVLIVFKLQIDGLLLANIAATLLTILFIIIRLKIYKLIDFKALDIKLIKNLISFSVPLIPNTLSWWVIATVDRFIILYYLGAAFNGMFAIAIKFPTILLMFSSFFNMAWQEKAIRTYEHDNRDNYYSEVFKKYFSLLFGLVVVLISLSKPMFKYVVQSSFYDAWKLTPFLYLAVGFQALSSFYGTGYLSSKDTKGAFTTTVYGAVITIVSNFVLIPKIGLLGASISIFLGYFTMFLARVLQTKKYFLVKLPYKQMLILLLSVALVSGLAFSNNPYFIAANIIIAVSIFIGTNMELIGQYKEKIRVQIMKNRLVAGSN